MSRSGWIVAGVVLLLVVGAAAGWWLVRTDPVGPTQEVTRGDIEVTIETVGTVQLRDLVQLTSPATSRANLVTVLPGDEVREGEVLVELDQAPFDAAIEEAEAAVQQAETNLSVIEATDAPTTPETIAERVQAQQQVEQARRALERAESTRAERLVLAPFDGTIINVGVGEGDTVGENSELVQIAELEEFELVLDIDEVDLPLIEPGADAQVVLEAYPDQVISSEVYSIARRAEIVGGTTVFPATIRFQALDGIMILPGMNAEVEITTDVRENVLLLPEGSFQTVGRRTFVDVVVDGDVQRREIRTGIRSGGMVEIADGLEEGDEVAVP